MIKKRFIDMEAVRVGLPTEDLAMLLALHMDGGQDVQSFLHDYYTEISKVITDYTFNEFIADYSLAVMLTIFHPIGIVGVRMNIYDEHMITRAVNAYECIIRERKTNEI